MFLFCQHNFAVITKKKMAKVFFREIQAKIFLRCARTVRNTLITVQFSLRKEIITLISARRDNSPDQNRDVQWCNIKFPYIVHITGKTDCGMDKSDWKSLDLI